MKPNPYTPLLTVVAVLTLFATGCSAPAKTGNTSTEAAKPDMAAIKAEIQTLENQYAAAYNARDLKAITALYTDDVVSMVDDAPMLMGKAAIEKDYEASFSKNPQGVTIAFEIVDVFGDENTVTEVGKTIRKNAAGKVVSTGKYMAIWEKRDGRYLCVRDISNDDQKTR